MTRHYTTYIPRLSNLCFVIYHTEIELGDVVKSHTVVEFSYDTPDEPWTDLRAGNTLVVNIINNAGLENIYFKIGEQMAKS